MYNFVLFNIPGTLELNYVDPEQLYAPIPEDLWDKYQNYQKKKTKIFKEEMGTFGLAHEDYCFTQLAKKRNYLTFIALRVGMRRVPNLTSAVIPTTK